MKRYPKHFPSLTSLALLLSVVLSACADGTPTSSGKVAFLVAESVVGSTAASVGAAVTIWHFVEF